MKKFSGRSPGGSIKLLGHLSIETAYFITSIESGIFKKHGQKIMCEAELNIGIISLRTGINIFGTSSERYFSKFCGTETNDTF